LFFPDSYGEGDEAIGALRITCRFPGTMSVLHAGESFVISGYGVMQALGQKIRHRKKPA